MVRERMVRGLIFPLLGLACVCIVFYGTIPFFNFLCPQPNDRLAEAIRFQVLGSTLQLCRIQPGQEAPGFSKTLNLMKMSKPQVWPLDR